MKKNDESNDFRPIITRKVPIINYNFKLNKIDQVIKPHSKFYNHGFQLEVKTVLVIKILS